MEGPQKTQVRVDPGASGSARRVEQRGDYLCAITDKGTVRARNEDTFLLAPDGRLLIVADGMGGHQAGEVASALAVEVVAEFLWNAGVVAAADERAWASALADALRAAHERIREAARLEPAWHGMGTTLIAVHLASDRFYACHVGDVRCYVCAGNEFFQLTRDHTPVAQMVARGELTADQARLHPRKNEVLQALGMPGEIAPDVASRSLAVGDRVLLCSDGLWEALSEEAIREVVRGDAPVSELAVDLVERAKRAEATDNITVVLYEHRAWGGANPAGGPGSRALELYYDSRQSPAASGDSGSE